MKELVKKIVPIIDIIISPIIYIALIYLKQVRKLGIGKCKVTQSLIYHVGVFPIRDHYYEPLFRTQILKKSLRQDRNLPGIDFNIEKQLDILSNFQYENELKQISMEKESGNSFYYNNNNYCAGDAEYLYSMIRFFKPCRIIEIGSGFSTLMALKAIAKNRLEDENLNCIHQCIEPYEMSWLESTSAEIIRKKVEDIDIALFMNLKRNDILFIDSSHIIRPQGDVLFEILELLPVLNSGVIIHFHDIFTPKDYLDRWVKDEVRFWNEQYLLEAFLSNNKDFEVIGALNLLKHQYFEKISEKCPILQMKPNSEPGAFWIRRK